MNQSSFSSVYDRRSLVVWAVFCALAGATMFIYVVAGVTAGHGDVVMPLDDVYIHFQYARQLALGQPYIYNPGLPPTSGATSFIYPYILACGYQVGFQGLSLGLWAMAIGAVAQAAAMWLIYKLVLLSGAGERFSFAIGAAFGLNGAVAWHFMSGMETGLVMVLVLGTLYAVMTVQAHKLLGIVVWATLLALARPEGGIFAVTAVGATWWQLRGGTTSPKIGQRWGLLLIPIAAVGVQPAVNLIITGSAVASGNAAKSVLGTVPFYWEPVIQRIVERFLRMWVEFGTGISAREGLYIMPLLGVLAAAGIAYLALNRSLRSAGLMVGLWLVSGTLMIATLDTAFWHFKRYQMPFLALLFPLAGWGLTWSRVFRRRSDRQKWLKAAPGIAAGVLLVTSMFSAVQFLRYYGLNVGYVYAQPLQMARWLAANTPEDAVVAVHDVGMMRYMGERTTLDIVGLTTKGAADYWRNGPGAVAELLMQAKPDYIASYGVGHGYGLGMIAETDIYGKPLAEFAIVVDDRANVALATGYQAIYKPDWDTLSGSNRPSQPSILAYLPSLTVHDTDESSPLLDEYTINVANIESEHSTHIDYEWNSLQSTAGFATEVRQMTYADCLTECALIVDGGRRITGEEQFAFLGFNSSDTSDLILVTRVHPEYRGTLDIYVDCSGNRPPTWHFVARRWIAEIPGQWLELATLVHLERGCHPRFRIVPTVEHGAYFPFHHWVFSGQYRPQNLTGTAAATFQNGAIALGQPMLDYSRERAELDVKLEWYTEGNATGDYKVFVHLYRDASLPPTAQRDERPGGGALPPGNWLPGVLHDTITVDLADVPSGRYQVAIGMYNPMTLERLVPIGGDEQGRLFIGEIEVSG